MSGDDPARDENLHKPFGIDELHTRVARALRGGVESEDGR
jgi:hypothetical protein